ncbi:MAG: GDP-mannose 4,6-dehydratase [Acidobacteriota bacterium]|nr:GDP-mannose 4,6-dehydratase [Acidobacteriota bacterium]
MRILITGISGFVGPYLARHIAKTAPEAEIWGLVWAADPAEPSSSFQLVEGDLTDISTLTPALNQVRPDIIFHLAAASSVASSWDHPGRFLEVNAVGTVNLLEVARTLDIDTRVVVSSSAEVYGAVPADRQPITEDSPLEPLSPYAASKAAQDLLTAQYYHGHGMPTIRLRLFHHTGPRRPTQFVASSFAHQIARIERGLEPPRLAVGNLEAVRDFTDVRDIARAYWLAAIRGIPGAAYNVCSSRSTSIRRVLDMLLAQSEVEVEIGVDRDRLRAADIPCLVGDHSRFSDATDWQPEIPLAKTLGDLLNWWRDELSNHSHPASDQ